MPLIPPRKRGSRTTAPSLALDPRFRGGIKEFRNQPELRKPDCPIMRRSKFSNLTQLGHRTPLPESPDKAVLETVPNSTPGTLYLVRFTCPEFTSLCPMTGQPDFAHIVI